MFAIVFQEFNDRAITVLSLSEALVGVGGMIAPLIGGGLYEVNESTVAAIKRHLDAFAFDVILTVYVILKVDAIVV